MGVACLAMDPLPVLPVALPSTACGHPDGAVQDPRLQGPGSWTTHCRCWANSMDCDEGLGCPSEAGGHVGVRGTSTGVGSG